MLSAKEGRRIKRAMAEAIADYIIDELHPDAMSRLRLYAWVNLTPRDQMKVRVAPWYRLLKQTPDILRIDPGILHLIQNKLTLRVLDQSMWHDISV